MFGIRNRDEGYTRGGMDVESAINLFFKGVLLFPIFLMAGYIGVTMMKHFIFHGIPAMNRPTPEQIERLQQQDAGIGSPVFQTPTRKPAEASEKPTEVASPVIDEEEARHHAATIAYRQAIYDHREQTREWTNCIGGPNRQANCDDLYPGQTPSFPTYYNVNYEAK